MNIYEQNQRVFLAMENTNLGPVFWNRTRVTTFTNHQLHSSLGRNINECRMLGEFQVPLWKERLKAVMVNNFTGNNKKNNLTRPHFKSQKHTRDHTFVMSGRLLVVVRQLASVQIHHILFSLRQCNQTSVNRRVAKLHFSIFFARLFPWWIYLLKNCLIIQVRRVTMATQIRWYSQWYTNWNHALVTRLVCGCTALVSIQLIHLEKVK